MRRPEAERPRNIQKIFDTIIWRSPHNGVFRRPGSKITAQSNTITELGGVGLPSIPFLRIRLWLRLDKGLWHAKLSRGALLLFQDFSKNSRARDRTNNPEIVKSPLVQNNQQSFFEKRSIDHQREIKKLLFFVF